ncbi:MAG TPA: gliding motility-associated C-terminal domain-containing protein [Puia sp.]|nr:gliding motility-associated C-terminal domain-containing protein [Puia sp.]
MRRPLLLTFIPLYLVLCAFEQKPSSVSGGGDLFGTKHLFIENVGQYADSMAERLGMGKVRFGYQGFGPPVYFTARGLIYIHRGKVITMRWLNANPHCALLKKDAEKIRFTYGVSAHTAGGCRRIIYKDLYPGIDIAYSTVAGKAGFEYTVRVAAGADPTVVRTSYGGNVKSVGDSSGLLVVRSDSGTIVESKPVCYYADGPGVTGGDTIGVGHNLKEKVRSFVFRRPYDRRRQLIIDPFVTSTVSGLAGTNAAKAMEVDYDYNGNVYVQGGTNQQGLIAKYDPAGNLLWTFLGSVPIIGWVYGDDYGGWTVEKTTGNVYVGIGSNGYGGQIIRLNGATGAYDNFETPPFHDNDGNNGENWKMRWFCNQGTYQVMIAGGSGGIGSYNSNIGILQLPTTNFYSYNITGITTYPYNQDVSDFVIDPADNSIFCILASGNTPFVSNRIYHNTYPYTAANQVWNALSGYPVLREDWNDPFMNDNYNGGTNLTNILAVNSSNLFYYDGAHLEAFDKTTGTTVGTPLTFPHTPLMEEGIYADECNDIFIGMPNGVIKVLKWTGSSFDDGADVDITIPGFSGNNVYALSYDPSKQLLYAAGDGFVGSFDISGYCTAPPGSTSYSLAVQGECSTITATLSPAPPAGATVTYTLLDGSTVVATNATGMFNGITGTGTYTVKADIGQGCTDITETANVSLQPLSFTTQVQNACGGPQTGILTVMTGGLTNVEYSIDNTSFQADSVFTGLSAGSYTLWVKGTNSPCEAMASVEIGGSDLTVQAGGAATVCAGSAVTLQGSTNGTNSRWTPSAGLSDTTVADPVASPLVTTKYYFVATKGVCTLADSVVITVNPLPVANAGPNTTVCYGQNTALQGSGGGSYAWSPAVYLSNPAIADPQVVDPLQSESYVLRVTDAEGCQSKPDTMSVRVLPVADVTAGADTTIVAGQTVGLYARDVNGTGFTEFSWSPAVGLDGPLIQAPMADPGSNITYTVTASTPEGCEATASIKVTVIKGVIFTAPGAFTPDGNGHNDVLRVIAVGIRELRYFAVFNRWGQEVFRTADLSAGWDGRIHGELMPAGTYVWTAEAVDVTGRILQGKGTVLLIR